MTREEKFLEDLLAFLRRHEVALVARDGHRIAAEFTGGGAAESGQIELGARATTVTVRTLADALVL